MYEEALLTSWNDFVEQLFSITEDLKTVITTSPTDSPVVYRDSVEKAFNELPMLYSQRFGGLNTMINDIAIPASVQTTMIDVFLQKLAQHATGTVDVDMDLLLVLDRDTIKSAAGSGVASRIIELLSVMSSPDNKLVMNEGIKEVLFACASVLKSQAKSQALVKSLATELAQEKLVNDRIGSIRAQIEDANIVLSGLEPSSDEYNAIKRAIESNTLELSKLLQDNDVQVLKQRIEDLQRNWDSTRKQAFELNNVLSTEANLSTIATLQQQKTSLDEQINLLQGAIITMSTDIKTLSDDNSASQEELTTLTLAKTQMEGQVSAMTATIAKLNDEIKAWEADEVVDNATIASLTEQKTQLKVQVAELNVAVDEKKAALDQLVADYDKLEVNVKDLSAKNEVLRDDNKKLANATAEIKDLTAQVDAKTAEIKNLTAQVDAKIAEIKSLSAQITTLSARVDTLVSDKAALSDKFDAQSALLQSTKDAKASLEKKYVDLEQNNSKLMEEYMRLVETKSNNANNTVSLVDAKALSNANKTLSVKVVDLESKVKNLDSQIDQLNKTTVTNVIYQTVVGERDALKRNVDSLTLDKTKLQNTVETNTAMINKLKSDVEVEKVKTATAETLFKNAEGSMQNLQKAHTDNTQIIDNFDMRNLTKYSESIARKVAMIKLEKVMAKIGERVDAVPTSADMTSLRRTLEEIKGLSDRATKNDFDPVRELDTLVVDLGKMLTSFEEIKNRVTSTNENLTNSMTAKFQD